MPRRPTETPSRWPIPGELYGYVERNGYGIAELRWKGKRRSLGCEFQDSNRKAIIVKAKKLLRELASGKPSAIRLPASDTVTVGRAVVAFWKARNVDSRSHQVRVNLRRAFAVVFPVDIPLNDDTLHTYLVERLKLLAKSAVTVTIDGKPRTFGPYNPGTMAKICDDIGQLFTYAQGRRWLLADPWATIPRPRAPRKVTAPTLTTAQVRSLLRWLLSHGTERHREAAVLLNLLRHTGMRISEALSLRYGDTIDDAATANTIEADRISLRLTKTERPREIPLSTATPETHRIERAVAKVRALRPAHPYTAFRWQSRPTPSRILQAAFRATGIDVEDVHKSHLFRATCEQEWLRAGIPEETVVRVIGHTKAVRRKHYHEKLTAEDALEQMKRVVR